MKKLITSLALVVASLFAFGPVASATPFHWQDDGSEAAVETATEGEAATPATEPEEEKKDGDGFGSGAAKATEAAEENTKFVVNFIKDKLGVPFGVAEIIGKAIVFIVTLLIFKILASIAAGLVGGALSKSKLEPTQLLLTFMKGATSKLVMAIGFVMALASIGVDVAPLLAGLGVLGFVVGFALQDTLGNFAAGVMILLYRPYDIGDVITAGGVTGGVKSMSLVSTTIGTPDNQVQIVPNGAIWGGVITNVTANDTRRVDLSAGIGYGDDMDQAEAILMRILEAHPLVLSDPAPVVKVHELADSSVNFVVRPWAKTSDYWAVYWDITKSIKTEFDKEGVSIPFPQRDIHLHKVD